MVSYVTSVTVFFALAVFLVNGANTEKKDEPIIALTGSTRDILPPTWTPGSVRNTLELSKINEGLDDVLRAGAIFETHRCAIAVANEGSLRLVHPKYFTMDGELKGTMPPAMDRVQTGFTLMVSRDISVVGSYGVMSYDIEGTDYQVVIMWSVPFNDLFYDNKFNVKIYYRDVELNKNLVNQMYEIAGVWTPGAWESRAEFGVTTYSSMTNADHAKLIVYVNSEEFDSTLGPHQHVWCDLYLAFKYCRKECTLGKCWTSQICSADSDCSMVMPCTGNC